MAEDRLTKLTIQNKPYRVVWDKKVTHKETGARWGLHDPEGKVHLYTRLPKTEKRRVLLHELFHALEETTGIILSENRINRLCTCLDDIFIENDMWSKPFLRRLYRGGL